MGMDSTMHESIKYVRIDIIEKDGRLQVRMPFGEMKQHLVKGFDGGPVRIENAPNPLLRNLKHCHTFFWNWKSLGTDFNYKNRRGTWVDFSY